MGADFVCNLKVYRTGRDLTQEQLAEIVGVRREIAVISASTV